MKAKEFYESERLKGNTEDITGNSNPDYDERFYYAIFELMNKYAAHCNSAQAHLTQPFGITEQFNPLKC